MLRFNGGATFAGNTTTGAVGIRARGTIFTGGTSLIHQFSSKLDLGVEIYGGYSLNETSISHALQEQFGGNYEIGKKLTLDFGAIAGQKAGSPHYGLQLGFSKDF